MSSVIKSGRQTKSSHRAGTAVALGVLQHATSEQQAREQAARLNLAMAAAQLGEWSWDAATDLLRGSARAAEILGVPVDLPLTRTAFREFIRPEDSARNRALIAQALAERREFELEFPVRREHRQVWVAIRGRGVYD